MFITLWRPNNAGYCYSKQDAGVYQEIEEGYHNCEGDSLPVDKAILDEFFIPTSVGGSGPIVRYIPNCKQVWEALNLKMTKRGLVQIGIMKYPETTCSEYNIGDVVPYINTRGRIMKCKIRSFHDVGNGKVWFKGIDTKTLADVYYPLWKSLELKKASKEVVK